MEDQLGYQEHWNIAASATAIRPATQDEATGWLNTHLDDAQYATSCQVGSKTMSLVQTGQGFQIL
jgi:hypothetical protein